ncbi:hypothetical protein J7L70_02420 [Candidatus Bathyarchaeota archaeon]|nr:hypothetical protein [Candidatus Bathyarchaeota archaeon]
MSIGEDYKPLEPSDDHGFIVSLVPPPPLPPLAGSIMRILRELSVLTIDRPRVRRVFRGFYKLIEWNHVRL